ncbi:Uncharacterized protein DAT39_005679, partial [Clarias magur]
PGSSDPILLLLTPHHLRTLIQCSVICVSVVDHTIPALCWSSPMYCAPSENGTLHENGHFIENRRFLSTAGSLL